MKYVVVIDEMPKNCSECKRNVDGICGACGELVYSIACPFKPMPRKRTYEIADDHPFTKAEIMAYTYGLAVGRNQVIDEILGETE